jgi:hypothetical protein
VRFKDDVRQNEECYSCGGHTTSGIYVRVDPKYVDALRIGRLGG